jgi:hypothetical protein
MTTPCELCPETGGALKPTSLGKWAHLKCVNWIPEVYTRDPVLCEPIILDKLDKKRFALKCSLCKSKGACIQCNYGRCSHAGTT